MNCHDFGKRDLLLPPGEHSLATTEKAQQAGKIGPAGHCKGKRVDVFAA